MVLVSLGAGSSFAQEVVSTDFINAAPMMAQELSRQSTDVDAQSMTDMATMLRVIHRAQPTFEIHQTGLIQVQARPVQAPSSSDLAPRSISMST